MNPWHPEPVQGRPCSLSFHKRHATTMSPGLSPGMGSASRTQQHAYPTTGSAGMGGGHGGPAGHASQETCVLGVCYRKCTAGKARCCPTEGVMPRTGLEQLAHCLEPMTPTPPTTPLCMQIRIATTPHALSRRHMHVTRWRSPGATVPNSSSMQSAEPSLPHGAGHTGWRFTIQHLPASHLCCPATLLRSGLHAAASSVSPPGTPAG